MTDPRLVPAPPPDALDDAAERFYSKFGFALMPPASRRAMYLLARDAEATVEGML